METNGFQISEIKKALISRLNEELEEICKKKKAIEKKISSIKID